MEKLITLGTLTSTGGKIITASSNMTINGKKVVKLGDIGTCPCGKKSCRGQGKIYRKGVRKITIDGTELAKGGDPIDTGCGTCFVVEPIDMVCVGDLNQGGIVIGGNGAGVSFGNNIFMLDASESTVAQSSQISQGNPVVPPILQRRPMLSSESAAQQAYDLTEKEWESDLQSDLKTYLENNQHIVVIYSLDDAVSVLKALAEKYGKTVKEVGAIAAALYKVGKSTYDAAKIAKSFGDFGMKVKPFLDKNGNERISISTKNQSVKHVMSNGVRIKLNSSKSYSVANSKVIQAGVSPKVRTGKYKGSVLITFVISASINTKDLILDDSFLLEDWLGNVGLDLFKAAIAIGAGECAILLLPTLPFIVEAFVCAAVASSLAYAYDYFEVDDLILKVLNNE
ncbi:PAAR domain-containing protein [Vibrio alginolyticus]|uniref:PAAR domain-containing protein n=1 Tax=Vibrio alginolyticus TaxID=663 RepID=UPI00211A62FD|nr:PAAR domain-containing protein [Vibrio alginolyticus]MCQ9091221.1 PAAR domain-containing protein [Vibrio alginolyticus]